MDGKNRSGLGYAARRDNIVYMLLVLQHGEGCQQAQEALTAVRTLWGERAAQDVLGCMDIASVDRKTYGNQALIQKIGRAHV